eukprot:5529-Prorocentrum_minimum.AAC.1
MRIYPHFLRPIGPSFMYLCKLVGYVAGERVVLPPLGYFNLVFEATSLDHASPATVRRLGVVCLNDGAMTWMTVVQGTLAELPPALEPRRLLLEELYKKVRAPSYFKRDIECLSGNWGLGVKLGSGRLMPKRGFSDVE